MDAGLYSLSSDQTNLDAVEEKITFNNVIRACGGLALSAGNFTFDPGRWLLFRSLDFTRTSGSTGTVQIGMLGDPSGTIHWLGGDFMSLHPAPDTVSRIMASRGPVPTYFENVDDLTLFPGVLTVSAGVVLTVPSASTWLAAINLDGPLVSSGLYARGTNQTNLDTVNEQVVWNSTLRACAGVSLASGELTFTEDGLYLVMAHVAVTRTSGSGTNLQYRFTTDAAGAGSTAYANGVGARIATADGTTAFGSNGGAVAIVERSGSNVTIGTNVSAISGTTAFSVLAANSSVVIMRVT